MPDRTDDIRKVVAAYDSLDFVSLRIEDAFDDAWWDAIGGRQTHMQSLSVDMTGQGKPFPHPTNITVPSHDLALQISY
jgi:cytoplasmic tRNA 2-thiolation protein 2